MKNQPIKRRCMDCRWGWDPDLCFYRETEDQKACEDWQPALTKEGYEASLKAYNTKKDHIFLRKLFKYMK